MYENAFFELRSQGKIDPFFIKHAIKKKIGKWINRPYKKDDYLKAAEEVLRKKEDSVVVDVGANIGITVLPLAKAFPRASFYAIEAHPLAAAQFIKNCELNHIENVQLMTCAVGSDQHSAHIHTCPTNGGGHSLLGFQDRFKHQQRFGPICVPMRALSEIFQEYRIKTCDLLKIDTEGYEYSVLNSLKTDLGPERIKCVIAEIGLGLEFAGTSAWDLVELMHGSGYSTKLLQEDKPINEKEDLPDLPLNVVKDLVFYKRK